MVSSLRNTSNAGTSIDHSTESDLNTETNSFYDDNMSVEDLENCEGEILNESDSVISMPSDHRCVQNDINVEEILEQTENFAQHSVNMEDMRVLHPNTSCTVLDVHCMIYAFLIRHNITWTAAADLIPLINHIIGKNLLEPSVHMLKKKIRQISNYNVIKHFVCHNCDLYLGTIEHLKRLNMKYCPNCRTETQTNTKYKKNHFVTIPLEKQLQDALSRNRDHLIFGAPASDSICDVHGSFHFRRFRQKMGNTPAITLTLSTDGAALFKSCKEKSVWPIQFVINEIELERRYKRENTFCAAISFGKTPKMQTFFRPFLEEIKSINESGGLTIQLKNGQMQRIKVFPMIFTADTPARADVLMKSYFNGYNGCSYCTHSGTLVNKQIRYCKRDNGDLRTDDQVRKDMSQAQATNSKVNGFKGMSPLMAMDHFDLVWQVGIDKMHNIDLGVTALLFNLFLDSKNRKERFVFFFGDLINIVSVLHIFMYFHIFEFQFQLLCRR